MQDLPEKVVFVSFAQNGRISVRRSNFQAMTPNITNIGSLVARSTDEANLKALASNTTARYSYSFSTRDDHASNAKNMLKLLKSKTNQKCVSKD